MNHAFWKDAGIRALRTFTQTVVAFLGGNTVGLFEIDWLAIVSSSALAALISLLSSISRIQTSEEVVAAETPDSLPEGDTEAPKVQTKSVFTF